MKKIISNLDKTVMAQGANVFQEEGVWRSEHSSGSYDLWGGDEPNELISQIFYWPCPPEYSFPLWPYYFIENCRCDKMWYRHFNMQVLSVTLVLEGYIEYAEDNKVTVVGPGEFMVQYPGSSHRMINADDDPTHKLVILFNGWGKKLFPFVPGVFDSCKVSLKNSSLVERKMRRIGKMIKQQKAGSEFQLAEEAYSFWLELYRQQQLSRQSSAMPEALEKICAFMERKNFLIGDIHDLAKAGGISNSTLLRLFQKHFGTTPYAYLMDRRLEIGASMLTMGHSVKDSALQCGFADAGHFSRAFKKKYGVPPIEYGAQS